MSWLWGPERGVSQYHGHMGPARMRRKLLKERIAKQQMSAGALWGAMLAMAEPEPSQLQKDLQHSLNQILFKRTVKGLYLAVPVRGDGRDGKNFIVTVQIKPDKPTETIISMQKNGFWGYSNGGRPTFVLPNSIAGKVTVIDVKR